MAITNFILVREEQEKYEEEKKSATSSALVNTSAARSFCCLIHCIWKVIHAVVPVYHAVFHFHLRPSPHPPTRPPAGNNSVEELMTSTVLRYCPL